MCGIVGYIGKRDSVNILINGLHKLEYRGYDSAGICVLDNENLSLVKEQGQIEALVSRLSSRPISGAIGIAHTRWATHGEPSERNAHPHMDCHGDIAIVHNGIIENYQSLKKLLQDEGHKIVSQTDSEIFAHLVEKFYQGDLEQAVRSALQLVEGAYGLAVLHRQERKIIAARRGSPLILGLGLGEMYIASDVPAILQHTKEIVYLDDNELAEVTADGYNIKNLSGQVVDKNIEHIKWSVEELEKKGYKHFMLKEIFEQPEAIANTLRGRVKNGQIKLSLNLPKKIQRIIISACGTSWHSGLIGKYLLESLSGIITEVDYASEFRYRQPLIGPEDLLIVISQSGETADTLGALREAKARGAHTLGIVNVVGSTISREVESGIYLHAGPEIGVASTKAFSCQVTALLVLALFLRQESGRELDQDLLSELDKLSEYINKSLEQDQVAQEIADKFKAVKNFLYLGRGLNFPVALEGALKLKEISYIHAEGYPAAEIKHGPIALVDKKMPVVFLASKSHLSPKLISNMQEIKARGGIIISVTNNQEEEVAKQSDYVLTVPQVRDELSPIINVIPLQLLAYHIADLRGLDVDKPRNLAKSVTVE
ncbi:MAG: glutamine--fructose-6-phosphate transaminase (isomerizing) [Parcubacteria group bacterium]|nr:MAG: glutamine--fructose-6-phosphate transaminase (isomerizing) [Parcubacteria group bacterium]